MRQHLRENSDYVGKEFADEARRIHIGESEQRGIWGEATPDDAKALKDEGIPVERRREVGRCMSSPQSAKARAALGLK